MRKTRIKSSASSLKSETEDLRLQELVFELTDVGQSKILVAIADVEKQREISRNLARATRSADVRFRSIDAQKVPIKGLLAFLIESAGSGSSLAITNINGQSQSRRSALLASLNFHRDAILRLPLCLLLWVNNDVMYELAINAPDLWSRRTAVIDLSDRSSKALIRKLFESSPIPRESWIGKDALSESLEQILSKEAQISQCKKKASIVDISRAKEAALTLLDATKKLLKAAESDRKIELSLWLWNLARVDIVLQGWLGRMDPNDRRTFEHMYLDRNEILLSLAEKMPQILKKYRKILNDDITTSHSISLLDVYIEYANEELVKITEQLVELNYQRDSREIFMEAEVGPGSIFTEMAAIELQRWLNGESKMRPRYLNSMEGDILKALYSGKPLLEEANQFGVTQNRMFEFVEALETKVRMVLGRSAKFRTSVAQVPSGE